MKAHDIRLTVHLTAEDLVSDMDRTEVLDLIFDIDKRAQDWDFTLDIAAHFARLHREYHEEAKKHGDDDRGCQVCKDAA